MSEVVNKSWWAENLLRHTDDLPEDAITTIRIDCSSGYNWRGSLWNLRDALSKAVSFQEIRKAMKKSVPIVADEMLSFEPVPPKWEYCYTPFNPGMNYIAHFNKKGDEGWELVLCDFDKEIAIFKRPK